MADQHDERRVVTALFADVAGSTALSERLDPEEAKLVIGEAVRRAIRAVEAYGGSINNLLGDGLLALFGAPVAHEDDPERAVRAGLDIVAAAREYAEEVRRSWGVEDFAMRVGIHTGEVVVGQVGAGGKVEYGVVGDTVNTTARLQGAADRNGLLVSEPTQRQVRLRFDWGPVRSLELKGKAEIVTAYPVLGLKDSAATPERAATPMVGRDAEMSSAVDLLQRLAAGRGGVLFIVGDPGIGKSRLAAELRQRAVSERCTWLEGRCVSYGESLPYWPYRDLLRNWLDVSPTDPDLRVRVKLRRKTDEVFDGHGADVYPYLATVMGLTLEPEAAAQLRPIAPESIQYRTFEVLGELLQRIAAKQPLVLALDDLHWADPTSLALTERLLALTESSPLMLAISQRPETDHPSWLLKEKAAREYRHRFRELALQPLGHESETQLLSSLANGRKLPPILTRQLLSYAEGNPFYLEQILQSLIDSGSLIPENGHWILLVNEALEIPKTLEGVIIARIDRLEPQWRDVLTSSSVLGRTFGLELIEAVTGLPRPALREAVHHLLRLDLFREEGTGVQPVYRYKHALIQEAAYHTLVGPRRKALHRRAAEWFESYYKERPERVYGLIAHHWLEAANPEQAARYLKLAGDRALAEWALDEAVGHYRGLIPLLEQAGRRPEAAETLFQLASTLHLAMRYREANETWQRAFTAWSPPDPVADVASAGLRITTGLLPWDADPAHAVYTMNGRLHRQIFDCLLEPRPGPYPVPGLVSRWDVSDDGLRYRFQLRADSRWNDGSRLVAQDIVDGLRHELSPATGSHEAAHLFAVRNAAAYATGRLQDVEQVAIRAVDELTLEFELQELAPYFPFLFAYPGFSGAVAGRGNGPYRIRAMSKERVVLERAPRYRRRRGGNIQEVQFVPTGDDDVGALNRGELDILQFNASMSLPAIAPSVQVTYGPPVRSTFLSFSGGGTAHPTDVHLRRALAYATDRHRLQRDLFASDTLATGGFTPPGIPGHTPDIALRFDPDLARASLKQSTHSGPLKVSVHWARIGTGWFDLIDGWRETLGLDLQVLRVDPNDSAEFHEISHANLGHWVAAYPDVEYFIRQCYHSASGANLAGWASPQLDAIIDRAVVQTTGAGRLALFHEADKRLIQEECAVIPIVYGGTVTLLQPWVHGFWDWGAPWLSFDEFTVDDRSPRYHGLGPRDQGTPD